MCTPGIIRGNLSIQFERWNLTAWVSLKFAHGDSCLRLVAMRVRLECLLGLRYEPRAESEVR